MSEEKRRRKRWQREHAKRTPAAVEVVYRPSSPEEAAAIIARAEAMKGAPFKQLPGTPSSETVMGTCADGTPIVAGAVEMVFNDAALINAVYGAGHYERTAGPREREVLTLARTLYTE